MALWLNAETGEQFDDGLTFRPGEDGFTRALAAAHFGASPFDYLGTPNWLPSEIEEEPETAA